MNPKKSSKLNEVLGKYLTKTNSQFILFINRFSVTEQNILQLKTINNLRLMKIFANYQKLANPSVKNKSPFNGFCVVLYYNFFLDLIFSI